MNTCGALTDLHSVDRRRGGLTCGISSINEQARERAGACKPAMSTKVRSTWYTPATEPYSSQMPAISSAFGSLAPNVGYCDRAPDMEAKSGNQLKHSVRACALRVGTRSRQPRRRGNPAATSSAADLLEKKQQQQLQCREHFEHEPAVSHHP